MPARIFSRRSAGSVFHQSSVSLIVVSIGRNVSPAFTARATETSPSPPSGLEGEAQIGKSPSGESCSSSIVFSSTQRKVAFEPVTFLQAARKSPMASRSFGPVALKTPFSIHRGVS